METTKREADSTAAASCDDSSESALEFPVFCADMRALVMSLPDIRRRTIASVSDEWVSAPLSR